MKRREFISALGAAAAWPVAGRAQPAKLPTVGFLVPGTPASFGQRVAASTRRLRELGWIEGRTVAIEYRWAEAQRFDEIMNEFVRLKVDVIFSVGTPPIIAAQKATSNIPIVFVAAGDPVGTGLVASLARPGGKHHWIVETKTRDLAGKQLRTPACEESRPISAGWRSWIRDRKRFCRLRARAKFRQQQRHSAFRLCSLEVHSANDIVPALDALKARADALLCRPRYADVGPCSFRSAPWHWTQGCPRCTGTGNSWRRVV